MEIKFKLRFVKTKKNVGQMIALTSVVLLILLLLFAGALSAYHAVMQKREQKQEMEETVRYHVPRPDITKKFLTKNSNSRPGIALEQINGVVIHYTANPGTDAKANRDYFESRKNMPDEIQYKVSSHFVIGLDGTIIQCIPLTEIAYASNDRNQDSVSIECCHMDKTGKFNAETRDSLVRLTAWLCGEYEITTNQVIRHYDVTGKNCPKYYVRHPKKWDKLKKDIYREMQPYRIE